MKEFWLNAVVVVACSMALIVVLSSTVYANGPIAGLDGLCPGTPVTGCGPNSCPAGQPFCAPNLNGTNCTCQP